MLMERDQSCLVVIDVQERLVPAMADPRTLIYNNVRLVRAATQLGVPVVVSEQYPKGIGPTVPDLREVLPEGALVEKMTFPLTGAEEGVRRLKETGRRQMIVTGTEAHVCVLQTALSLITMGYEVFVVADAVASRTHENAAIAMDRLRQSGVQVVVTEMVMFEWLGRAGTPDFKALSPLIK